MSSGRTKRPHFRTTLAVCLVVVVATFVVVPGGRGRPKPVTLTRGPESAWDSVERHVERIALGAGDRLIVASLDGSARNHQVVIRRTRDVSDESAELVACSITSGVWRTVEVPHHGQQTPHSEQRNPESFAATVGCRCELNSDCGPARTFHLPWFVPCSEDSSRLRACASVRPCRCRPVCRHGSVAVYVPETLPGCIDGDGVRRVVELVCATGLSPGGLSPIADIDGDGGLSLVLCELSEKPDSSVVPLMGCVRAEDFLSCEPCAGDIVYLDARWLRHAALPAVMLHELTHAAIFSRMRTLRAENVSIGTLPVWMNEAIAHSCEYSGFPQSANLKPRIDRYLTSPGRWPLLLSVGASGDTALRGAGRAAGLFFVESQRSCRSLALVLDQALRSGSYSEATLSEEFAEQFRDWTVWMVAQQMGGTLDLQTTQLPSQGDAVHTQLRGTAATWWYAEAAGEYRVESSAEAALQITVVHPERPLEQVVRHSTRPLD